MSRRSRLERRAERQARRPGGAPPRPGRARPGRPHPVRVGGGGPFNFLGSSLGIAGAVVAGVGLIVGALVYVVSQTGGASPATERDEKALAAIMDADPNLPGTYVPPHPGADGVLCSELSCFGKPDTDDRRHVADDIDIPICTPAQLAQNQITNPVCYHSNPPTSGPHSGVVGAFRIYENPLRKENAMHSMEHGGVVVWYNTSDQAAIDKLKSIVQGELDRGRLVVMTRYTGMEAETIALTAWTRLDKFPVSELTEKRVKDFIEEHNKRFNPEGF